MRMIECHQVGGWRGAAVLVGFILWVGVGCKPVDEAPRAEEMALGVSEEEAAEVGWLVDVTERAGLDFVHQFVHQRIANILLSNGSGGAVFRLRWRWLDGCVPGQLGADGGRDPGWPAGTKREPNRLYRNLGDGTFVDVTRAAGLEGAGFGSAAVAGDFDNDGHVTSTW
jgi:hypothetical protein